MRSALLIALCLIIFSASAGLMYDIENVRIIAFPNETLEYRLNITNNDTLSRQVYINKLYIDNTFTDRNIDIEPSINLVIPVNQSRVVNISIPVSEELALGIYRTLYRTTLFVSYANTTDQIPLEAVIMSEAVVPIELQNITIISPSTINPLNDFNLTITLLCNVESVNPLFKVVVSSDSSIIYESNSIQELARGINVFDWSVKLPDKTLPGFYEVLVEAVVSDILVNQGTGSLMVNPYSQINHTIDHQEDLFGKSVVKSVVNDGTSIVSVNLNYSASLIEPWLVSRSLLNVIEGDSVVSSETVVFVDGFISEDVTLSPGQVAELVLNFNYGFLLVIPFIVVLSIVGWFFITKRVTVFKEIIQAKKEDGELMVKVGISVKNVSLNSIKDVRIIEDLPVYAKKVGGFGSIKGEVNREKGIIVFNAGRLDPKEEVLVSYKFKTDTELIGRVRLPPVTIKYRAGDKVQITKSNTPIIHLIKGGQ